MSVQPRVTAALVVAGGMIALVMLGGAPATHAKSPLQAGVAVPSAITAPTDGLAGRWHFEYEVPAASSGAGRRGGGPGGNAAARGGQARGADAAAEPARGRAAANGRGGRAGRGAAGPVRTRILLDLTPGPASTLTGSATVMDGGNIGGNAPGSQPVEIADGHFDGSRVSFEVWTLDNYRNRTRYDGLLAGSTLTLTLTREMPAGVETIAQVTAVRLPY